MAYTQSRRFLLALMLTTSFAAGCGDDSQPGPVEQPEPDEQSDDVDAGANPPALDAAKTPIRDASARQDASVIQDPGSNSTDEDAGRDAGQANDAGDATVATPSAFPSVDGKWDQAGPFAVTTKQGGPDHTLYYPTELGRDGLKHPVILWGNGTGVTPSAYTALLQHWASHGFIVAAANTTQSGSGQEMLAGADWLAMENGRSQSAFFGKVDVRKVAATGHSQGGGGAIAAGADPAIVTTMPIQPGPQGNIAKLHGPMFILGGANDTIVVPGLLVEPRYKQATQIQAIYGLLAGATHFEPAGNGGRMRGPMTAWLRSQLMDDASAKDEFFGASCGLCGDADWTVQRNFK